MSREREAMFHINLWDPSNAEQTDQILNLLNSRLNGSMTREAFLWKHAENPLGPSTILYALDNHDEMVAVRSFMKWQVRHEGREIDAVQPCDTATAAHATRKGLFTQLTRHGLERLRSSGVEVVYNFPQGGAMAGASNLGWYDMGGLEMYVAPVRFSRIPAIALASAWGRNFSRCFLPNKPPTVTPISSGALHTDRGSAVIGSRSPDILHWRITQAPHRRYIVTERDGNTFIFVLAWIGDFREVTLVDVFAPEGDWESVSKNLYPAAKAARSDILRVLISSSHPLRTWLRQRHFVRLRSHSNFVVLNLGDVNFASLPWHVTPFDIDTF